MELPLINLRKNVAILLNMMTRGDNNQDSILSDWAKVNDNFSECWVAIVFGTVSENIRRITVVQIAATKTP